jgi:hypothetical protein
MENEQQSQKKPKKGSFFLQYILPVIIGVVGGWFLNAYMMPENKDAKALIKTQAEQVQATREGFNKLADAIQRNNMTDIVNNANMVGNQINGLSSTTNSFLTEFKLPVVKGEIIQKVVADTNRINDTAKLVISPVPIPPNREIKIKIGDKNALQIDKSNYLSVLSEYEETGNLEIVLNGKRYGDGSSQRALGYGGKAALLPVDKITQELLYKGKDETRGYYIFVVLDPVK